jgi:hypothetical protein
VSEKIPCGAVWTMTSKSILFMAGHVSNMFQQENAQKQASSQTDPMSYPMACNMHVGDVLSIQDSNSAYLC